MRKAAVRHGDPTTTRGVVLAYSSTIHDDGKKVALSGDEATCGNCNGTFKIFGTGKGMSEKGRDVVVDGDLVLCPCKKNRVIVGSNPGIFLETGGYASQSAHTVASDSPTTSDAGDKDLECYYEIADAMTGKPVEGMIYKLLSDRRTLVDDAPLSDGRTRSFPMLDHPSLTFVAWRAGNVR